MTYRICLMIAALAVGTACADGPRFTDPDKAGPEFALQGEYAGEFNIEGQVLRVGVQVIALGNGKFKAVGHNGGLPGAGWTGEERNATEGELRDGVVEFETEGAKAEIRDGTLQVTLADGTKLGDLPRVQRTSLTMGDQPPAGAVVLFDGSNTDAWQNGRMTDDEKLLMEGTTSKETFGDHQLHIEFRLPFMPEDTGQARGNSGLYMQGRYEIQMLDSFGLTGEQNECGGLYSVKAPSVNMCLPPLTWQTYDIDYTAARYDAQGTLMSHPRITVKHNGVTIHNNVELPGDRSTTAAPVRPGAEAGPVYLQNHNCPVRFRNIWVVKK